MSTIILSELSSKSAAQPLHRRVNSNAVRRLLREHFVAFVTFAPMRFLQTGGPLRAVCCLLTSG